MGRMIQVKDKETFLKAIKNCKEQNKVFTTFIKMPDLPRCEQITNPTENLEGKLKYYDKAYNENLELISFPQISIIGYAID